MIVTPSINKGSITFLTGYEVLVVVVVVAVILCGTTKQKAFDAVMIARTTSKVYTRNMSIL